MLQVQIGDRTVGEGYTCFIVGEIGINHNGDVEIAKSLIAAAAEAGFDAVKFQKRTVEVVYTADELAMRRESPFGTTNGDLKVGLELGLEEYKEIDRHCRELGILWFASCWDEGSVDFIEQFDPPCYKIASACLTDEDLLLHHRSKGRPIILATGMSTLEQIDRAVEILGTEDLILLHSTSTYPAELEELNLRCIGTLRDRYPVPIGYSGHEVGLATTVVGAALGACVVERHITLSRAMWGSDHAASIELAGLGRLVKDIRQVERALGDGVKVVYPREISVMKKLRRKGF